MTARKKSTDRCAHGALVISLLSSTAAAAAGAALLWMALDPYGLMESSPATHPPLTAGGVFQVLGIAAAVTGILLVAIFQWRVFRRPAPTVKEAKLPKAETMAPGQVSAVPAIREQRLFTHLLSRLQRDGRLLDFLAENLDAYDDGQIGAAVRGVHAGCRSVVEKLLAPRPLMVQTEQARVTLGADYDPARITLTGQVSDHPPFDGIVRHTGWRATRIQIPLLSEETDPAILAPAEVEVESH
jgi:hypothetical protein